MAADETHHVKMLVWASSATATRGPRANRDRHSTTVILKVKAVNLVPEISNRW